MEPVFGGGIYEKLNLFAGTSFDTWVRDGGGAPVRRRTTIVADGQRLDCVDEI